MLSPIPDTDTTDVAVRSDDAVAKKRRKPASARSTKAASQSKSVTEKPSAQVAKKAPKSVRAKTPKSSTSKPATQAKKAAQAKPATQMPSTGHTMSSTDVNEVKQNLEIAAILGTLPDIEAIPLPDAAPDNIPVVSLTPSAAQQDSPPDAEGVSLSEVMDTVLHSDGEDADEGDCIRDGIGGGEIDDEDGALLLDKRFAITDADVEKALGKDIQSVISLLKTFYLDDASPSQVIAIEPGLGAVNALRSQVSQAIRIISGSAYANRNLNPLEQLGMHLLLSGVPTFSVPD